MTSQPHECDHPDVRCVEARGFRNVACFVCGRLFGHLNADGYFTAYNPPDVSRRFQDVEEATSSPVSPNSPFGI